MVNVTIVAISKNGSIRNCFLDLASFQIDSEDITRFAETMMTKYGKFGATHGL